MDIKKQVEASNPRAPKVSCEDSSQRKTIKRVQLREQEIKQTKIEDNDASAIKKHRQAIPNVEIIESDSGIKHQNGQKYQQNDGNEDSKVYEISSPQGLISKSRKARKTRTLITKQKLLEMNRIFQVFLQSKEYKGRFWNLKAIASYLELGYSTILHKFREFRSNRIVRAGALISSLQKKRKYRKSIEIEKIIEQAMKDQEFYTAVQMTNHIQNNYNIKVSRSIISRHLGEMGYSYRNIGYSTDLSRAKLDQVRKLYAEIMKPLIERRETLIYLDEMSCCFREGKEGPQMTVSIVVACTIYGVLYFHLQDGFINRQRFYEILKEFLVNLRQNSLCRNIQGKHEELYLVVDMNSIHRDDSRNMPGIASMLIEQNAEIYYIPPNTPEFNPIEPIFQRIRRQLISTIPDSEYVDHRSVWGCLQQILQRIKREATEEYFLDTCQNMAKYMQSQPLL